MLDAKEETVTLSQAETVRYTDSPPPTADGTGRDRQLFERKTQGSSRAPPPIPDYIVERREKYFKILNTCIFAAFVVNFAVLWGPFRFQLAQLVFLAVANGAIYLYYRRESDKHLKRPLGFKSGLTNTICRDASQHDVITARKPIQYRAPPAPPPAAARFPHGVPTKAADITDDDELRLAAVMVRANPHPTPSTPANGDQLEDGESSRVSDSSAAWRPSGSPAPSMDPEPSDPASSPRATPLPGPLKTDDSKDGDVDPDPEVDPASSGASTPSVSAERPRVARHKSYAIDPKIRYPGESLRRMRAKGTPLEWRNPDCATFFVRSGPDYDIHGVKKLSGPAMFDVVAVDLYQSESKIRRITEHVTVPPASHYKKQLAREAALKAGLEMPAHPDPEAGDPHGIHDDDWTVEALGIPPIFIVNIAVPSYPPPNLVWGAKKEDGHGYAVVSYMVLNENGRKALREKTPAGQLLYTFCNGLNDTVNTDRFKGIVRVSNIDDVDIPRLAKGYNAKPFLTRPQHEYYITKDYIEIFVDCHIFSYVARKGLNSYVMDRIQDMVLEIGYVVEARANDEMPEQMMGAVQLDFLKLPNSVSLFDDDK